MKLYKTIHRKSNGEVFFGLSPDARRSIAFTAPQDFSRIATAAVPDREGRASVKQFPPTNWARRLARLFFSGPRLRAILARV